jgi:hypothetical protein
MATPVIGSLGLRRRENSLMHDFYLPKPLSIEYGLSPTDGPHQAIDSVESIGRKTSHIDEPQTWVGKNRTEDFIHRIF